MKEWEEDEDKERPEKQMEYQCQGNSRESCVKTTTADGNDKIVHNPTADGTDKIVS